MRRTRGVQLLPTVIAVLLTALLPSGIVLAQTSKSASSLRLYDNFNRSFIDPSKWSASWQCGPPALECVREIQDGQLRLHSRAYGATDSNDGTQFGSSIVNLTASLKSDIAAQVLVRVSNPQDCATNAGAAHSQVLISGAFFNGGGGTAADDVQAYLQLDRFSATNPGTVEVGGFLQYQGLFFDNVDLGPVNLGERVKVELQWDQPNHRFVARLLRPAFGTTAEQSMPYTISDTTGAASPFKSLSANVVPANCAGTTRSADLEVLFDSVMTN
jgi:hypothetical protein